MLERLVGAAQRRWSLDPRAGVQVVPANGLAGFPVEPSRLLVILPSDGEAALPPVPGRHAHPEAGPLDVLARLYPGDQPVLVLRGDAQATGGAANRAAANGAADARATSVAEAGATTVAALEPADLAAGIAVAPLPVELAFGGAWTMAAISARLRRPDGCPWDREQTHQSLRKHLLEEAYEVYDALEAGATPELAGELGDLLLQVVLHAQLAAEAGVFDLSEVEAHLARKIVRRHPHVFGEAEARTAADVTRQWEQIKAGERADSDPAGGPRGALDGISAGLPALAASQEMQERAAALGYDWPDIDGVLDKVAEELAELAAARDAAERTEEFGDLLLVMVNVGRRLGIESEAALRAANRKFRSRFGHVERLVAERGVAMRDLDFAALDELWDAAKVHEREARNDPDPKEAPAR
ncbi:MAG TPA: nucleoside triphosphate pyrophosphohydrolase [Candidatus Limnocylindrales bacterium]